MKRLLAFFLIISCIFTTGCWDQIEITDLALVIGTALDKGNDPENKVALTIQVANPRMFLPGEGGGGDGEKPSGRQPEPEKLLAKPLLGLAIAYPGACSLGTTAS